MELTASIFFIDSDTLLTADIQAWEPSLCHSDRIIDPIWPSAADVAVLRD